MNCHAPTRAAAWWRLGSVCLLLAALAALAPYATAQTSTSQPDAHRFTLQHGGLSREYLMHLPSRYRPGQALPLVLSFHGGGGNMDIQANDRLYGLVSHADKAG